MDRRLFLACLAAFAACSGAAPELVDVPASPDSTFRRVYGDPALRERFFAFLVHVFHLFPEDRFHALIARAAAEHATDEEIYRAIAAGLPEIRPTGSLVTYALPALQRQKSEMARQVAELAPGEVEGYVEMGTTGRYTRSLERALTIRGERWVLNDAAPSRDPVDLAERGQLAEVGTFVPLGNYDPIAATVPDGAVGLFSNLIGFHHCPPDRLPAFVESVRRVIRPGGRLVVREHDVVDASMNGFVALAHDVFNVGVGLEWEENAAQVRAFRSVADWEGLLGSSGFRRLPGSGRQEGDPTDNLVLVFERA